MLSPVMEEYEMEHNMKSVSSIKAQTNERRGVYIVWIGGMV
jgi:hypothetical protein